MNQTKPNIVVIGGGTAATLISMPLARFLGIAGVIKKGFFAPKNATKGIIEDMVRYGEIARRDGILALEGVMDQITDPFMARGIQLAVDGNDPEMIEQTLESEMDSLSERHQNGKKVFELLGNADVGGTPVRARRLRDLADVAALVRMPALE